MAIVPQGCAAARAPQLHPGLHSSAPSGAIRQLSCLQQATKMKQKTENRNSGPGLAATLLSHQRFSGCASRCSSVEIRFRRYSCRLRLFSARNWVKTLSSASAASSFPTFL